MFIAMGTARVHSVMTMIHVIFVCPSIIVIYHDPHYILSGVM